MAGKLAGDPDILQGTNALVLLIASKEKCGAGEDPWESLQLQGDQTSQT